VITPKGFDSLPTQEVEYDLSGFIPTNKQTNKQSLNYVAGYTDPTPFFFEWTKQVTPLTTRGKPWQLCFWAGSKFVQAFFYCVTISRRSKNEA